MLSVFTTLSPSQHQTKTCIVFAHSNLGLPSEKKRENVTLFYTGAYSTCGVSQVVLVVNNPSTNPGDIRDTGSIPGSGRSPGGGHRNPLQYSCLENPMDRGTCWAMIHRVTKSWTWLNWRTKIDCTKRSSWPR